jgi:ubiquinone/menaquinone biosynthesis C-methylase UbiE
MDEGEKEQLLIRVDERIKNIYNRMDKFETLFTNHLHHHELWENDLRLQMRWWIGIVVTIATGSGAMMMGVV